MHTSPDRTNIEDEFVVQILNAICTGDLATLRAILKVPEHRSLNSPEGKTLLHVAAECGHPSIVDYLLESGWSVDAKIESERTPLHFAAHAMIRPGTGEVLFGVPTPWYPGMSRHSPAIEQAILQLMRLRGMAAPESIGAIDELPKEERSPLYDAALELMEDRVTLHRELLASGIPFDPKDPTFHFVRHGYPDYLRVVDLLITYGAEVNVMDERGESPLSYAVASQSIQIVECLLQNKADPNLKLNAHGRWYSSPMESALECNAEAAALLYRFGGKVDFSEYPLHRAAGNGQLKLVLWFLEIGGDINQRAPDGDTPLLRAAGGTRRCDCCAL